MSYVTPNQTNFTAGAISPLMYGRTDIQKYKNALADCENFYIYQQGPLFRRSGSRYSAEVKNSAHNAKLIDFEYSTIQAYVLELGNQYMRVYKNGVRVGAPFELALPYLHTELPGLEYEQSASVLYLTHFNHAPREVKNTGSDTGWSTNEYNFLDGPYLAENTNTGITVSTSAASGSATVTASPGIFAATDTQRHIRLRDGTGKIIWGKITAFSSSTSVTVNWIGGDSTGFTTATPLYEWRLGCFYTGNFPRYITFYEERIVFASTPTQPDTLWMSKAQDYENFAPTEYDGSVVADNGITVLLPSNKVNAISAITNLSQKMLVLTIGGPWLVTSSDGNPLTPSTIVTRRVGELGGRMLTKTAIAGSSVFYLHRSGRTLYELAQQYDDGFSSDTFFPEEASILSEHLLREGGTFCKKIVFQQEPDPRIWILREDGVLLAITYNRQQTVYGFQKIILGGDGVVEDLAITPSTDGTEETVFLIVNRLIDGVNKRYVEYLTKDFFPNTLTDKTDMFFVDSGITVTGSGLTTVTGLGHLEGEEVLVVGDGAQLNNKTVASGQITLEKPCDSVVVGLPYTSRIKTLEPEAGGNTGTAQGMIKRIDHISVRALHSLGMEYQASNSPWVKIDFRVDQNPMDTSPPFFTGDRRIALPQSYETTVQFQLRQEQPYPLNIVAITYEMKTSR